VVDIIGPCRAADQDGHDLCLYRSQVPSRSPRLPPDAPRSWPGPGRVTDRPSVSTLASAQIDFDPGDLPPLPVYNRRHPGQIAKARTMLAAAERPVIVSAAESSTPPTRGPSGGGWPSSTDYARGFPTLIAGACCARRPPAIAVMAGLRTAPVRATPTMMCRGLRLASEPLGQPSHRRGCVATYTAGRTFVQVDIANPYRTVCRP